MAKFERKGPSSVKKTKPVKNDLLYDFDDDDSEEFDQEDSAVRTVRTYLQNNDRSIQLLNNFPSIKKVYMKYNTIMPSSAGPERLFSKGKLVFNTKRHTHTVVYLMPTLKCSCCIIAHFRRYFTGKVI